MYIKSAIIIPIVILFVFNLAFVTSIKSTTTIKSRQQVQSRGQQQQDQHGDLVVSLVISIFLLKLINFFKFNSKIQLLPLLHLHLILMIHMTTVIVFGEIHVEPVVLEHLTKREKFIVIINIKKLIFMKRRLEVTGMPLIIVKIHLIQHILLILFTLLPVMSMNTYKI